MLLGICLFLVTFTLVYLVRCMVDRGHRLW